MGPCASVVTHAESAITAASRLEERTVDAPIPADPPGLDAVEVVGFIEVFRGHLQDFCRLGDGRLFLATFIRAAGLEDSLFALPNPGEAKSSVREPKTGC